MHLFGLKFNLANVWGLPLIIGTAAEFGLNVVLSYMEGRAARRPAGGAKHGDGRPAERDHDHHRLREPDGRDATRASSGSGSC